MAYLVRALVILVAALYLASDTAVVSDDGAASMWVIVIGLAWVAAFLVTSWQHTVGVFAWLLVGAAILSAVLSWWLSPAVAPPIGDYAQFTWPGAATIGASAVAGRIIVLARSWAERVPAVLIVVATAVAAFLDPATRAFFLLDTGLIFTCAFTIAAVAIAQRHRIAAERQVAVAEERARFADELHDRIAHEITGIVVLAQGSAALAANGPVQRPLELIESSGLRAMEHIRTIVGRGGPVVEDRRPPALTDTPESSSVVTDVSARLARIIADFAGTSTARIERPEPVEVALAAPVWEVLDRAVREALTNVRRHASTASCVRIQTSTDGASLSVAVDDDGSGGGLGTGGGHGLHRLSSQLRALGGHLEA
ncbi:MAG: histidine kinase, partial [Mobilicoccus sp.]|nr:histidine kinase [Mobilicoccus sp.]